MQHMNGAGTLFLNHIETIIKALYGLRSLEKIKYRDAVKIMQESIISKGRYLGSKADSQSPQMICYLKSSSGTKKIKNLAILESVFSE